jgi:hypothetical protein
LSRVAAGITGDAKQFLSLCALFIEKGVPLPTPFADALATRLREIGASENPWTEKLLKRNVGQKSCDEFDWKNHIAREVWLLRKNGGKTLTEAAKIVSKRSHVVAANAKQLSETMPGHPAANTRMYRPATAQQAEKFYLKYRRVFDGEETQLPSAAIERAGSITLAVTIPCDEKERSQK